MRTLLLAIALLPAAAVAAEADWVSIPAGSYASALKYEDVTGAVPVAAFELQRRPVTNAEFLAFASRNPAWRRGSAPSLFAEQRYLQHWGGPLALAPAAPDQPVVNVSWFAAQARLGVVASANFSIGVNLFTLIVAEAARLMQSHDQYGAWIHEQHHAAKRDAPSGTALQLRDAMAAAGFGRSIDMSSARAGMIPGTHIVGFDAASDTIELTHRARDRRGFAGGALLAARWIQGREGWYSMADVLRS
jgi:hypothetical protein